MNTEELKTLALGIITAGFEAGKGEDDIKMDMFGAKIPFSKLNSLFRSIAIEQGLMVDPKTVTNDINEKVEKVAWDECETWSSVEDIINAICDSVDGATVARVTTLVRSFCRDEEIELPVKPKASKSGGTRAAGGKVPRAMADLFAANQLPTREEFYAVVRPLVKGHRNAIDYMNMFYTILVAAANNESLAAAGERVKDFPIPADNDAPEVEAAEESDDEAEDPVM